MLNRLYQEDAYNPDAAPSWWEASAPPLTFDTPRLDGDTRADVVIVGAGYTGLSAALALAGDHDMDVRVLDAARPGWGASGRNGGFCCFGGTRLDGTELIAAYGEDDAQDIVRAQVEAIDSVAARIEQNRLEVDKHGNGELLFVHRERLIKPMREEAQRYRDILGVQAEYWEPERCNEAGLPGDSWFGGLYLPHGFGLHPLKYLRGLAEAANSAGARIHGLSEVIDVTETADGVAVKTANGCVRARAILFATNGYHAENLPDWFAGRFMPVQSAILVTRPMTADECAAHNWTGDTMCADTRALLHYFRMLPDGRFMFGGRGGTRADARGVADTAKGLRKAFERIFPSWKNIETDYAWSGFVCLSADSTAFVGQIPQTDRSFASLAYWGGGVSMASWCGEKAGHMIAARLRCNTISDRDTEVELPSRFRQAPDRFPFPALRIPGLKLAYAGYTLRDEWL